MILVAENDTETRKNLLKLLAAHRYEAEGVSVDSGLKGLITEKKPGLLIAGVAMHKESEDFRLVKGLTEDPLLADIPVLLMAEAVIPEKTGVRKKNPEQIRCDGFFDKPIDVFECIHKVRVCTGTGSGL